MKKKNTMRRLLRYLKKYWLLLILSLLFAALTVAMTLYLPILIGQAVDLIVAPGQVEFSTIARALVRDPEILILDDSASALDYATDARLRKAIRAHDANVTVFLVSQRAASIQYADQILVLDDGALVGQGTHAELLESCPVYQEIYYSQFPKEAQNA